MNTKTVSPYANAGLVSRPAMWMHSQMHWFTLRQTKICVNVSAPVRRNSPIRSIVKKGSSKISERYTAGFDLFPQNYAVFCLTTLGDGGRGFCPFPRRDICRAANGTSSWICRKTEIRPLAQTADGYVR